jgi:hypothetical protein
MSIPGNSNKYPGKFNQPVALFKEVMSLFGNAFSTNGQVKTKLVGDDVHGAGDLEASLIAVPGFGNSQLVSLTQNDHSTQSVQQVDYAHHEIHEGSHFYIRGWSDVAVTTTDFLVRTADTTKWCHTVWDFATEGEFEFELFEDTVVSADGTSIAAFNNNRNSSKVATLQAFASPTVTTPGTSIWMGKTGTGRNAGGDNRADSELVLKQGTDYLFRFTKVGAGTLWLDYEFSWYEHTNKAPIT